MTTITLTPARDLRIDQTIIYAEGKTGTIKHKRNGSRIIGVVIETVTGGTMVINYENKECKVKVLEQGGEE